jgi:hypothetical protein
MALLQQDLAMSRSVARFREGYDEDRGEQGRHVNCV